jgi:HK97 family phage major capsid protein
MVTVQLGATVLSGLTGNVALPRANGGAVAYWLPETGELTRTSQVIGQVTLSPKRLCAATAYSKTLLVQSSVDVENFVRADLMNVLAIEKDKAALQGTNAGGEPKGVYTYTADTLGGTDAAKIAASVDVATLHAAGTTWAAMVAFETAVATSNADMGKLGYAVTPGARSVLKTTAKAANTAQFIWEPDPQGRPGWGMINGYPAVASLQVPDLYNVVFANWADLVVADWIQFDLTVDPYTLSTSNQVSVVLTTLTDVGLRHTKSFSVASSKLA